MTRQIITILQPEGTHEKTEAFLVQAIVDGEMSWPATAIKVAVFPIRDGTPEQGGRVVMIADDRAMGEHMIFVMEDVAIPFLEYLLAKLKAPA